MNAVPHTYLNVMMVEGFEDAAGKAANRWTKIGVAFPHKDGTGFNIQLSAVPVDGKLVVVPPLPDRDEEPRPPARETRRR